MAKIALEHVVKVLRNGGLVVFPTDTVYGLLVDAKNKEAVEKLIAFKNRPAGKPISVFVRDLEMMAGVVELGVAEQHRLEEILPGPYTVILKSKHKTSNLLESETGTLGVRIPKYDAVTELVARFAGPVTATSANRSGHPPVHSVDALMNQLNDKQKEMIDLVVDIGTLPNNKPSTVVDMSRNTLRVLREGDLKFSSSKAYKSNSPDETIEVAKKILKETLKEAKPIVYILEGDLGAGKTQFVKGVAEELNIAERIISPTFVIYYEYKIPDSAFRNLIHIDLYNVKDAEEFTYLGMEKYLDNPNIFCIEWGEKSGEIIEKFKEKAVLIYIHIKYTGEHEREIVMSS